MAEKKTRSLFELKAEQEALGISLYIAKQELFKLTPIAKLGNPQFESWRKKCTDLTRDFLKLQNEIEKLEKNVK